MASLERMLLIKIIQTGGLKQAIEWGIEEEDFITPTEKVIWRRLVHEYTSPETAGSVIGPELAKNLFPTLEMIDTDSFVTVEHLCFELRKQRLGRVILEQHQELLNAATIDPLMAVGMVQDLYEKIRFIQPGKATDVGIGKGFQKVNERYNKMRSGDTIGVMPWPWEPLQARTKGIQPDDYIVLYGRPKSMKTWVLVYLIYLAIVSDKRVLFYTKEMTDLNLYMRIAACMLHVIYDELRLGSMTAAKEAELLNLRYWADQLEENKSVICLSAKDAGGRDTVAWLQSKVEKYGAQIVFIDGIYLMSTDGKKNLKDNERVMLISRQIREMILHTCVPVIATVQANRKAEGHSQANLDEIAFSDALSQDCTMAIRVIKSKNETPNTVSLVMGGLREFDLVGFKIYAVPCVDFSFHSLLTQQEVDKAQAEDDPDEPAPGKGNGQKKKPKAAVPTKRKPPEAAIGREQRLKHLQNLPK